MSSFTWWASFYGDVPTSWLNQALETLTYGTFRRNCPRGSGGAQSAWIDRFAAGA